MPIHALPESMPCPFCDGTTMLCADPNTITYKGISYNVTAYFFKCGKCREEFTTNESDTKTLAQVPGFVENAEKNT